MPYYKNPTTGETQLIENPDLNPNLIAGRTQVTSLGAPITGADLAPVQAPQIPPQPVPTPPTTGGTTSVIDANTKTLTDTGNVDTAQTDLTALFDKYMANIPQPPSAEESYKTLYGTSGIETKQAAFNVDQAAYQAAQDKFKALNAQLQGLNYQSETVIPNLLQQQAEGRGITAGGLAPIQASEQRKILLQAAPIQYQALIAQSEVANAQGRAELSQSILQQAQDHLDKIFQIHQTDSTNQYNYKLAIIDKVYDFADKTQQKKLDAQKDTLTKNQTALTDALNAAQGLSTLATQYGQGDIGAKITQLARPDINSKTFVADLQKYNENIAILQGQIKEKAKVEALPSDIQSFKAFFPNTDITTAVGRQQFLDWQAQAKAAERKGISTLADLTPAQQSAAFKLSDDFEQASKDFFKVRDAYNRISASATDPSAAGDLALIFNYMKILDPGSVVREGEFATAQNSAGVPDRIRAQYNKTIEGTRLAPATREDFVNRSQKLFDNALKQQKEVSGAFSKRAEAFGIPSSFVIREVESVVPQLPKAPKTDEDAQNILENISTEKPIVQPSTFWPDTWNQITSFFGF